MQAADFRKNFPILSTVSNGYPLIYLDNAATTQLPEQVITAFGEHYRSSNANVHRGVYQLSRQSTAALERTRETLAEFLGASSPRNIVFTSGTTEAINLVANSYCFPRLRAGDNIVVAELEHHSDYLPWLELCKRKRAKLRVLPAETFDDIAEQLDGRTRLVAVAHVTNTNGYRFPLERIIPAAHSLGVPVLVDGAQAVRAETFRLSELDPDFYCLSGHKMFAPAGTGALYVSKARMNEMQPVIFGGGMISRLDGVKPVYEEFPYCLEAGTGNYAGLIAWKAALDLISACGREWLAAREKQLSDCLYDRLSAVPGVRILGDNPHHLGCCSFTVSGIHPMDAAMFLDQRGIAVRSGHHCAIPAHRAFGAENSLRASVAAYNTEEEIGRFTEILKETILLLG